MPAPLNVQRNNYHENKKNNVVFTPDWLSAFIANLCKYHFLPKPLDVKYTEPYIIFDPAVGTGQLLKYFTDEFDDYMRTYGCDIIDYPDREGLNGFWHESFLEPHHFDFTPDLVVVNPPFNTYKLNKEWLKENKMGKALLPEVFIDKIFSLWPGVKLVSIVPMGFRLNQRMKSSRWKKYYELERSNRERITSIMSIPLDTFEGVEFHAEVLFWNMYNMQAHYWANENYIRRYQDDKTTGDMA